MLSKLGLQRAFQCEATAGHAESELVVKAPTHALASKSSKAPRKYASGVAAFPGEGGGRRAEGLLGQGDIGRAGMVNGSRRHTGWSPSGSDAGCAPSAPLENLPLSCFGSDGTHTSTLSSPSSPEDERLCGWGNKSAFQVNGDARW